MAAVEGGKPQFGEDRGPALSVVGGLACNA